MVIHKQICGTVITKGKLDIFIPLTVASSNWKHWKADLNYYSGKRNGHRVLWSNDGLMFVTYNHYESFIEVIGG